MSEPKGEIPAGEAKSGVTDPTLEKSLPLESETSRTAGCTLTDSPRSAPAKAPPQARQ